MAIWGAGGSVGKSLSEKASRHLGAHMLVGLGAGWGVGRDRHASWRKGVGGEGWPGGSSQAVFPVYVLIPTHLCSKQRVSPHQRWTISWTCWPIPRAAAWMTSV